VPNNRAKRLRDQDEAAREAEKKRTAARMADPANHPPDFTQPRKSLDRRVEARKVSSRRDPLDAAVAKLKREEEKQIAAAMADKQSATAVKPYQYKHGGLVEQKLTKGVGAARPQIFYGPKD